MKKVLFALLASLGLTQLAQADNIAVSGRSLCLELRNGSDANGTPIQIWACTIDNANQKFGLLGSQIRTRFKCLTGGASNGDPVVLASCNGSVTQNWTRTAQGELRGANNRCLDVPTSQFVNGTALQMYNCNNTAAQKFSVFPAEQCFGAIGNGCMGAAPAAPGVAENLGNGYRRQRTSVGSILHDNCCRQNPGGQHCQGFSVAQESMSDAQACVLEWRKAVYNSRDNRWWNATFGQYGSALTSDDLTQTGGRGGALFNGLGQNVGTSWRNETVSTRRLKAPTGSNLDIGDEGYCASGRFSSTQGGGLASRYGVCQ